MELVTVIIYQKKIMMRQPPFLRALLTPAAALAFFGVLLSTQVSAKLAFEQTEITSEAELGDTHYTATYRYKNLGEQPVQLRNAQANCGCTVPEFSKEPIPPGQSGELTAVFEFGDRLGDQKKTILITTDEPQTYLLQLNVFIPRPVTLNPRVQRWSLSGDDSKKVFTLTPADPKRVRFEAIPETAQTYNITHKQLEDGQLELTVTPSPEPKKGLTKIPVVYRIDDGPQQTVTLYLIVS